MLGKPLMPWQQHVADVVLEVDELTGELAYQEFGLTVPRQSGKSTLLLAKAVHRARASKFFVGRQKIVYTAQTRKDAREKFEEDYVEDLKAAPSLRAVPRMGNGTEHVRFPNGSRFGIEASTEKTGHGKTLDEAYIDEAFAQMDGRLEQAFRPAMITRRNKQLGWISTAGWSDASPYLQGKVAKGRALAEMGVREGLAYFEWSAPDGVAPDDRGAWWDCMPALGLTITERAIAHELETMENPNDFRRAYLNQWVPKSAVAEWTVIPRPAWAARRVAPGRPASPVAFGIGASWPDAEWTSITVAGRIGEVLIGQIADRREGVWWVTDRAKELTAAHENVGFAIDPSGPAGRLVPDLEAAGVKLIKASARDVAQACGQFYSAVVSEPYFSHFGEAELEAAVAAALKHPTGDAWRWNRDATSDPLESVTLAAWGHVAHSGRAVMPAIY